MRNFLEAIEGPDVVEGVDGGAETPVEAEDLPVHQSRQRQVVEQIREVLPHVGIAILPQALVVEAVHLSWKSAIWKGYKRRGGREQAL